jgi:Fur family peroxide stress response transcriptional regulator
MDEATTLVQALKQSGLRITPQRMAICELLASTQQHPTAQMIYEDVKQFYPSLSLATVYNTLEALADLGVLNELGSAGDNSSHYDADLSPHVNLACVSCHRVINLPSQHIHHVESEVAATSGYRVFGARMMYYGLCPDCMEKVD